MVLALPAAPPVAPAAAGASEPALPAPLLRPHVFATRAAQAPTIDGRLDDPVWDTARPSGSFVQHFPDQGAPPSEHTQVRVLYDDRNLYVGIDCPQTRSPVVRRLMRRDGQLPSDGVWFDIDSRRDGVTAFHFSANAAGALADALHYDDMAYSSDWDGVWEAKVADTGHGYSVEFRIPLSTLRFSALPVQDWGFQVRRFIDARQETDDWAFYPRDAGTYVPLFGRIDNLVGLAPTRFIELRPFVLGHVDHRAADADATLAHGITGGASAGLDAKLHLSHQLSLDLAVNPDFGQVEADAVILNLSTFETFFPEKRPFFLEGIDTFASIRPLVYTRRIGRPPAPPVIGTGQVLVESPQPSPIYGAAKLVGTLGGGTTIGLISALTGPADVQLQDASGARERRRLDPLALYDVLRIKQRIAPNTEIGVLGTATNRFESPTPSGGVCPVTGAPAGADGRCTSDAYAVSTDGRWRSPGGNYGAAAQAIATTLRGGPQRPERDGLPLRPGTVAGGGSLYLGKDGGSPWLWTVWQHLSGRQLELNDLGYLERKNDYLAQLTLSHRTLAPWRGTLQTQTNLQLVVRESLDGLRLWRELKLGTVWTWASFWSASWELHGRQSYFDDREMGDGSALQRAANLGVSGQIDSDPRRRVTTEVTVVADRRRGGGFHGELAGRVTLRALPQLELDLLPTAGLDTGAPRYIATDPALGDVAAYQLATQFASSVGATLRAAYTFTPELSLQFYTQLFLARVHYGSFFTVAHQVGARDRVALDALGPPSPLAPSSAPNPDVQQATLNVNLVLRWEYRLGSTLFLVYTRAQTPALVPAPGGASLDVGPLLRGRAATDVVMVKLAYWFG